MATLWKKPDPKPGQPTYTIDIPGAVDLFHWIIPALNDKQLKKERIQRMLTHKSPVPEELQWIPDVINQIDDAQDILTTGLWLGKPLIKKLPSRWLPFVGWALTVSDIASLCTNLLALVMTPGLTKPDYNKFAKRKRWSKKYGTADIEKWLRPGGWRRRIADYLQAAQAADTITGVGLTLGSVMGFASDFIWGAYQAARGAKVEFRLPPEGDPLTKAYRYVTNTFKQFFMRDILSPEDHAIILAAQNIATDIILTQGAPVPQDRANQAQEYQIPNYIPWEPSSREALQEMGWDLSRTNYYKPYITGTNTVWREALEYSMASIDRYGTALRNDIGTGPEGNIFWMVGKEAAENAYEHIMGWTEDDIYQYTMEERAILQICELNFKVDAYPPGLDAYSFLQAITTIHKFIPRERLDQPELERIATELGIKWSYKY